ARLVQENAMDVPQCDSILAVPTLAMIGSLPSCQWYNDGQVLQVLLGDGPTVQTGSTISTLPSVLAAADTSDAAGALTAVVVSSLAPVTPGAVLQIWPPQALPCSSVILSGTLSTGAAGRHFSSVAWRFGTADVATGGLEAFLNAASTSNSLKLEIPGTALSTAVAASAANLVRLEIVLQVTNWLGLSSETSDILTVDRSGTVAPLVYPSSITNRTIQSSQAVSFSVATRYADQTACGTA
ncbi:unnamed protein product, partial [Durusdinium trenchii]